MEQIREYIEAIFIGLPKNREIVELRQNMLENMEEKYHELIENGLSEDEAVGSVIRSIGTARELKMELGIEETELDEEKLEAIAASQVTENLGSKVGMGILFSGFLYVCSPIIYMIWGRFFGNDVMAFFSVMTVLLIASVNLMYWLSRNYSEKRRLKKIRNGEVDWMKSSNRELYPFIWSSASAIFLVLGFVFNLWQIAWIVFPVAAALGNFFRFRSLNK